MRVSELPYRRTDLSAIRAEMDDIIEKVEKAVNIGQVLGAREDYLRLYKSYSTESALAYMRYSINTADEFYCAEKDYYDETGPEVESLCTRYAAALLDSPFRPELERRLSPLLFRAMEQQRKAMSPEIIPDMVRENALVTEYSKLMAGLEFQFQGRSMTRAELMAYLKNNNRQLRREAMEVLGRELMAHRERLDGIFDELVHLRDGMAKKLGYDSFVTLGYYRMGRLCYGEREVEIFRENVKRDIVPAVSRLRTENALRLGITDYKLYDNDVTVPGGEPTPCGKAELFEAARGMYRAMGRETGEFIDMMLQNEAFDVDARKNKWGGGYCTEFAAFRQPFILANFNGTSGDVDVVTHEAGHALNAWLCFDNRFALELGCGGMETAETHSMSMEFLCWPYMERFFGEDAAKYRYMHALDAFSFIPYGVIVDKFQHVIYKNPDMSPAERNRLWLELEREYRPHISMEGIPYLEEGTRWQYQMHIYESPFYYIDYCLAQTAAFNFLLASRADYPDAFERYMRLSRQGGERLWTELLEEAGFASPFAPGALRELAARAETLLEEIRI